MFQHSGRQNVEVKMNNVLLFRRLMRLTVVLVMVSTTSVSLAQSSVQVGIIAVKHQNVRLAPGTNPGMIGNVRLISRNGSIKILTKNGVAFDVKASATGRIVGWTEGRIKDYPDQDQPLIPNVGYPSVPTFFSDAVVVWRDGKSRRFVPEKLYTVVWKFVKDGAQIGIGSAGSHGPTYLQLFDTSTGKLIDSRTDHQQHLPSWTQRLF